MDTQNSHINNLSEILLNSLNEHGILFQEACKYQLERYSFGWTVTGFEYPVSFQGQDTKIDMIVTIYRNSGLFVIVECKRANPEYKCWLFGANKTGYRSYHELYALNLKCNPSTSNTKSEGEISLNKYEVDVPGYAVHSWQEVKLKTSPDSTKPSSNLQNIEGAFSQVLKGVSGFATEQLKQRAKGYEAYNSNLLPVVITTASLYIANYDISDVSISTGKIGTDKVTFGSNQDSPQEQPWVIVHYGASESISSNLIPEKFLDNDPKQLLEYKLRSIIVVNSDHLTRLFKLISGR